MKRYGGPGRRATRASARRSGVDRAERLRRLSPGAGEEARPIEAEAVDLGRGPRVGRRLGEESRHRLERPVGDELDRDAPRVERLQAVHGAEEVGEERRRRTADDLLDEDLRDEAARRGRDLAAALELVRQLGDGRNRQPSRGSVNPSAAR
jgi:hypothetical protein